MTPEEFTQAQHLELLEFLKPLVEFMQTNNYHFFLVAGKNNVCSRCFRGEIEDTAGMITGMMNNNEIIHSIIKQSLEDYQPKELIYDTPF
jgi:hypothetical protein